MNLPNPWKILGQWMVLLCLLACDDNELPPQRYAAWIAAHRASLSNAQAHGPLRATLTYLPADLLAIREAGLDDPVQIAAFHSGEALPRTRVRARVVAGGDCVLSIFHLDKAQIKYGKRSTHL